ncbi:hemin uptake protein HemP [Nitrospira japonica]|uniref:hemin uptake protein HemP n=1 Tax=Nitrospira japonica TaxID=1325564 RepID=UPI0038B418EF
MKPPIATGISRDPLVLTKSQLPMMIVYNGRQYVLILTKQGKLLLNKSVSSSAS